MKPAAFAEAVRRRVFPGAVVLDLGGDFAGRAVVACRAGAARVLSVQTAASLPVAREVAAVNGCSANIEFIGDASAEATGRRGVDVILADARGGLPVYGRHLAGVARRIGSPAATPIPRREHLVVTIVSAADAFARHVFPWSDDTHGIDLGAARRCALNAWSRLRDVPARWLAVPTRWATIDYANPDVDARTLRACVELSVTAPGLAHGLAVWSSIDLDDEVVLEHATVFFPWLEPVAMSCGDRVVVTLRVDAIGSADVWGWTSGIEVGGEPVKRFEQSTFWSDLQAPGRLRKAEDAYVPVLGEEGRIVRAVLTMMSNGAPIAEIAGTLAVEFSHRFPSPDTAEETIARLASNYGGATGRRSQS